jgi:hypothetical protein
VNPLSIHIVTYTHIHPPLPSHIAVVAFVAVALHCHHEPIQISPRRILKKYRQAANNAAINSAITDLVAARNVWHADGGKRLIKSSNSYKNVIESLQSAGVNITYDAMMKRVSRASVEDIIT